MGMILVQLEMLIISDTVVAQEHPQKFSLAHCIHLAIDNSYAAHKANLEVMEGYYSKEVQQYVLPQINASIFDHNV